SWIDEKIITRPEYFVPEEQRRFNKKHALYERYGKWNIYGKLYRETFSKIIPFAVGKVIWYQGESNTSVAESKMYAKWLKALVDSWRADLMDSDIPFIIVQIADLDGTGEEWTSLQRAQEQAVKEIPLSELVVSKDISDRTNIHPADKLALSERIYKALYD
ncbi:MAG: hypothetical protein IJS67_04425, partial [Clostridia bacterium]|nr:hypothetical protein [Clostridia bacterium]